MIKKLISTFLVMAMIVSSFAMIGFSAESTIKFTDVDENTEVGKAIYKLVDAGIVNGNGDGTFTPNNNVTRAELCKMVNNVWKFTKPAATGFSDVTEDKWYYNHVLIGKEAGYINGFDDGTFRGDDNVTREQVCAILYRVDNMNLPTDAPIVSDEISDWAIIYVMAILNKGLIPIEEGSKFRATEDMKRSEVALVLAKYIPEKSNTPSVKPGGSSTGGSSTGGSSTGGSSTGGSSTGGSSTGGSSTGGSSTGGSSTGGSSTGGSSTGGSSTGGSSTGGSSTGGSSSGDTDTKPEVKDYTEENKEVVASLTKARDELKAPSNYNRFTSGEKKIINDVVKVLDNVIAEDHEYLITTAAIATRYDDDILNAMNRFADFSEEGQATFISKLSGLDEETFDFLCTFFGVDPDDYSDILDKVTEGTEN